MVKITKIYTRTGDDGSTGLVGGSRVPKDSLRVKAYGELDELNSFVGAARTQSEVHKLSEVTNKLSILQNEIFDLGAELATPGDGKLDIQVSIEKAQISRTEQWIDSLNAQLPELRSFVLPGGTAINASLHICRTVCRRVERSVIELSRQEPIRPEVIQFLNRLSDLFFAMARYSSDAQGSPEYLWEPGKSKTSD